MSHHEAATTTRLPRSGYGDGQLTITWVEFGSYAAKSLEILDSEGAIAASGDANAAVGLVLNLPAGDYTFNDTTATEMVGMASCSVLIQARGASQTFTLEDGASASTSVSVVSMTCTYPANDQVDCDGNWPTAESCTNLHSDQYAGMCCNTEKVYTPSGRRNRSCNGLTGASARTRSAHLLMPVEVIFVKTTTPVSKLWSLSADGVQVLGEGLDGSSATYAAMHRWLHRSSGL